MGSRSFSIACDDAYGDETDDAVVALPKSTFMLTKTGRGGDAGGEVVSMSDDEGQEIVGVVVDVEAEFVHVDFNHPLAGLDLHFEGLLSAFRRKSGPVRAYSPHERTESVTWGSLA